MLPDILTSESRQFKNDKDWHNFLSYIGEYANTLDHDFLSQICYEHSERFNSNFPKFDVNINKIKRVKKTASEIYRNIRYDSNIKIDFWHFQIDDYLKNLKKKDYEVLNYIIKNGTWNFPPIIIKNELANNLGNKDFGNPIHLVEGTHRVSFINRLYELHMIKSDSKHTFLEII